MTGDQFNLVIAIAISAAVLAYIIDHAIMQFRAGGIGAAVRAADADVKAADNNALFLQSTHELANSVPASIVHRIIDLAAVGKSTADALLPDGDAKQLVDDTEKLAADALTVTANSDGTSSTVTIKAQ